MLGRAEGGRIFASWWRGTACSAPWAPTPHPPHGSVPGGAAPRRRGGAAPAASVALAAGGGRRRRAPATAMGPAAGRRCGWCCRLAG